MNTDDCKPETGTFPTTSVPEEVDRKAAKALLRARKKHHEVERVFQGIELGV